MERHFHRMLEKLPGISAAHPHNDGPSGFQLLR
jgi:hypothetical protein